MFTDITLLMVVGMIAIAVAYKFEFVNGCHDAAHACGTIIAAGVLSFWPAVLLVAAANFLGAYTAGTAVANTIGKIVTSGYATSMYVIISALLSSLMWNVYTWYRGIPVSSTHCLVGALVGAGVAAAGGLNGVNWSETGWAFCSIFVSPFIGYGASYFLSKLIILLAGKPGDGSWTQRVLLPWLQLAAGTAAGYGHGANDGQKTMGIITLILVAAFGYTNGKVVPDWVILSCAFCMLCGTAIGGGRIIDTIKDKMVNKAITPHDGFAAQLVTAVLVLFGSKWGLPLSTTQTCTFSVLGAGHGLHGEPTANMQTVALMVRNWFYTFGTTALMAAVFYWTLRLALAG